MPVTIAESNAMSEIIMNQRVNLENTVLSGVKKII